MSNRPTDAFILDGRVGTAPARGASGTQGTNNVFAVQTSFTVKRDEERAPIRLAGASCGGHQKQIERALELQSPFSVEMGPMKPRKSAAPVAPDKAEFSSASSAFRWFDCLCCCLKPGRGLFHTSQYEALPSSADDSMSRSNSLFGEEA